MTPTKEELVELIGMADLLVAKLKDIQMSSEVIVWDAENISDELRRILGKICSEQYLETLRDPSNGHS